MKKKCYKCEKDKEEEEFYFKDELKGIRKGECIECFAKMSKNWYLKNRDKQIEKAVSKHKEFKIKLDEIKSKSCCKKCGEKRIYVLDFHHLDPLNKKFNLGRPLTRSNFNIIKEIEKCILLCQNCHSEFHYLEKLNSIKIENYLNGDERICV